MFSERFLQLYNDELRYLREAGQQFSLAHPQVARHLGMHTDGVLDPFVERLLEGSAFLCARVQEKLNSEQPEFALQMLSRLASTVYRAGTRDHHHPDPLLGHLALCGALFCLAVSPRPLPAARPAENKSARPRYLAVL